MNLPHVEHPDDEWDNYPTQYQVTRYYWYMLAVVLIIITIIAVV